tara:strand:+ start:3191 stop:4012 length:822 start_codon:yes stop_codon:yes gene_type:complete
MKGSVLAFVSIKGGVGKTTLALETASSLANNYGKKVLLVDGNFHAPNIGLYLDLTNKENFDVTLHDALLGVGLHNAIYESHGFDVVPAAFDYEHEVDVLKLGNILSKFKSRYDFIILDSSPNYEDLKPIVAAADKLFVVTTPDEVTLKTSLKAAKFARRRHTPVAGIVVNRIRSPRHEMNLQAIEAEAGEMPVLARIKDNKNIAAAAFHKTPITVHDSGNVISQEVRRFVSALVGSPEEPQGFFQKILPFQKSVDKERANRELLRKEFYRSQL